MSHDQIVRVERSDTEVEGGVVEDGLQIYKNFHKTKMQTNSLTQGSCRLQMLQKVAKLMTKTTIQPLDGFQPGGCFSSPTRAI